MFSLFYLYSGKSLSIQNSTGLPRGPDLYGWKNSQEKKYDKNHKILTAEFCTLKANLGDVYQKVVDVGWTLQKKQKPINKRTWLKFVKN